MRSASEVVSSGPKRKSTCDGLGSALDTATRAQRAPHTPARPRRRACKRRRPCVRGRSGCRHARPRVPVARRHAERGRRLASAGDATPKCQRHGADEAQWCPAQRTARRGSVDSLMRASKVRAPDAGWFVCVARGRPRVAFLATWGGFVGGLMDRPPLSAFSPFGQSRQIAAVRRVGKSHRLRAAVCFFVDGVAVVMAAGASQERRCAYGLQGCCVSFCGGWFRSRCSVAVSGAVGRRTEAR